MNEHRENSSQRNYLSKHFIRKHIILSLKAIRVILTGSWIISQPFHASKSGRRHQMSTPKSVSSRIKHLWNNYKHLNFHLETELPWPLMCKLHLKILLKRCRFSFFSEQDKRSTVKKPTRLKSLRANQCSAESFFSSFSTKRKLIDDSFELSGSHLCLKTVHSALHWEATQQNSPLLFLANKNYHMKLYDKSDKLTIFTISRKKHLQQLVLVFQKL